MRGGQHVQRSSPRGSKYLLGRVFGGSKMNLDPCKKKNKTHKNPAGRLGARGFRSGWPCPLREPQMFDHGPAHLRARERLVDSSWVCFNLCLTLGKFQALARTHKHGHAFVIFRVLPRCQAKAQAQVGMARLAMVSSAGQAQAKPAPANKS